MSWGLNLNDAEEQQDELIDRDHLVGMYSGSNRQKKNKRILLHVDDNENEDDGDVVDWNLQPPNLNHNYDEDVDEDDDEGEDDDDFDDEDLIFDQQEG